MEQETPNQPPPDRVFEEAKAIDEIPSPSKIGHEEWLRRYDEMILHGTAFPPSTEAFYEYFEMQPRRKRFKR